MKEPNQMQNLVDVLSKGWRATRSLTQLTLNGLITELLEIPPDTKIEKIGSPHSYRGYYSDLAFEKNEGTMQVSELLEILRNKCLDQTFEGYKGGDFQMDQHTPLWIAEYGSSGVKIMGLNHGDIITFVTQEDV